MASLFAAVADPSQSLEILQSLSVKKFNMENSHVMIVIIGKKCAPFSFIE